MPIIEFGGNEIECEDGTILRDALLDAGESPHNGVANTLNCGGHATCGTCAVEVDGPVSEMESDERRRLSLPPHSLDSGLRLACQTQVRGDIAIEKHGGICGQHVADDETAKE
jgi:ferredoxin